MDQFLAGPHGRRGRPELRIAVVGSGFAGIGLAVALKRAGFRNFIVFEKAASLGGTWRENHYPGAACDVPSHLYSFSFAPKADWRHRYSSQADILAYLEHTAESFGIVGHIRFNCAVEHGRYDASRHLWVLETSGGVEEFDIFIPAVGQLSLPVIPAFAGLSSFQGAQFHSARWDHAATSDGRSCAVVGSAASAVQLIPELAKTASRLFVFQRTPNWVIPRLNHGYGAVSRTLFRYLPGYRRLVRTALYWYQEALYDAFRIGSQRNRLIRRLALWHQRRQIKDPGLRAKLTPEYELGCKRLLISDDYLPAFNRSNVELVTEAITEFTPTGIRTADGRERPIDMVVFATGFDVRNCLQPVDIRGRDGVALQDVWRDGPYAYHGVAVPGFPNLFILYGPNTNLGHSSIIFMLECQHRYILQCLEKIVADDLDALEVSADATTLHNVEMQRKLAGMVWATGCGNWYGSGDKITANWWGSTTAFWREMRRVDFGDYQTERRRSLGGPAYTPTIPPSPPHQVDN